ncbi:DVU0524 family FlgM-associated protein [Desulfonatronum thioautotrophicum]|uniref:DVU0524 family FlgM-associated protein n=1 Tax=Desulfonatronum thioautotrophicum TaxID=617001 RepID=UPI0005EBCF63|nr:DVU0524 family FlgM-associated protein [Desulfonatronum thioautotrophicum]
MTIQPFNVQNMLRVYGQHLDQGRRMARYRMLLQRASPGDVVNFSQEARRRQLVEKVATEIMDSLMVSGSNNPVVLDIKKDLQREFGFEMEFRYLPLEPELQILRKDGEELTEITGEEKTVILERFWRITLDKVNKTML